MEEESKLKPRLGENDFRISLAMYGLIYSVLFFSFGVVILVMKESYAQAGIISLLMGVAFTFSCVPVG